MLVVLYMMANIYFAVLQPLFVPLFLSRVTIGSIGDSPKGQRSCKGRQLGLSHNPVAGHCRAN